MAVKEFVDTTIAGNTITVFSKTYCPYCRRAKALLKEQFPDVPTAIIELDERKDGSEIQEYLGNMSGHSTVPNIFINKKHIGGSDDLAALHSKGTLKAIVVGAA